ncbi:MULTISPECIES: hypothetical protein [Burkholderia cepacia complex]|uniref:hypothetical protein n=1 Tax=Burkholderia cepacia complex TaxID=87882 RepID=UPI00157A9210|nr:MULTISPECIES: hypothetical protein [Burkholderia cepacia complex]NTY38204.1 hypothetical protein [Burkholderia diffusa]
MAGGTIRLRIDSVERSDVNPFPFAALPSIDTDQTLDDRIDRGNEMQVSRRTLRNMQYSELL